MEQIALNWAPEPHYFSVSELTAAMRGLLADQFTDIWVAGEISGVKLPASGHYYFTLKDQAAQKVLVDAQTGQVLKVEAAKEESDGEGDEEGDGDGNE